MRRIIVLSSLFLLVACNGAKKDAAEKVVQQFYKAVSDGNDSLENELYVDVEKIRSRFKSDTIIILDKTLNSSGQVEVKIKNKFTNFKGTKFEQEIKLIVEETPAKSGKYKIVDSYNVGDPSDDDSYVFAVKTGFLKKKNDLSDMETSRVLKESDLLMMEEAKSLYLETVRGIEVIGWTWSKDEYSFVSGKGKIKNNTSIIFPRLKGMITFYNPAKQVTKSFDRYLVYDTLKPGGEVAFDIFTDGTGDADFADIKINLDNETVFEELLKKKYTGNEAAEYRKKNPSSAKKE